MLFHFRDVRFRAVSEQFQSSSTQIQPFQIWQQQPKRVLIKPNHFPVESYLEKEEKERKEERKKERKKEEEEEEEGTENGSGGMAGGGWRSW